MNKRAVQDAARDAAMAVIQKCADRAVRLYDDYGIGVERRDILMDLMACHFKAQTLRLDDLLAADDFNFMHDIVGINRHLNRETGELMNGFSPRFSLHLTAATAAGDKADDAAQATTAKPAALARTYTPGGTATLVETLEPKVADFSKIDLKPIQPFLREDEIMSALRGYARRFKDEIKAGTAKVEGVTFVPNSRRTDERLFSAFLLAPDSSGVTAMPMSAEALWLLAGTIVLGLVIGFICGYALGRVEGESIGHERALSDIDNAKNGAP